MLDFHFERDTHIYRDDEGHRVLSVTQILQFAGLIDYSHIPLDILERKARIGTLVHEATEIYEKEGSLAGVEIPPECQPYVDAYMRFRDTGRFQVRMTEHQCIADVHGIRYGMKLDNEGLLDDAPTLLEKKCTAEFHPAWGPQTAAYDRGIGRPQGYATRRRVALHLKPDTYFQLHPLDEPSDFSTFVNAHSLAAWKINKGLIRTIDLGQTYPFAASSEMVVA